jgi:hypothetical protein
MRKTLFMMYRGGESARGSNESAIGLSCPASAKVLANAATGVCNVILDLSREAGSRTASAACRVQQSCWQPGGRYARHGAIGPHAPHRHGAAWNTGRSRPGRAVQTGENWLRSQKGNYKQNHRFEQMFHLSLFKIKTQFLKVCVRSHSLLLNTFWRFVPASGTTCLPSAPRPAPACHLCASPGWLR